MKALSILAFLFTLSEQGYAQNDSTLIPVKCRGGVIMSKPDWQSEVLVKVPSNHTVYVFKNYYENDYFKVRYQKHEGYLTSVVLYPNEEVIAFSDSIATLEIRRKEKEQILSRIKETDDAREAAKKRREFILKKYGESTGNRILRNEYWIGMTASEARASLGDPERINRTTSRIGEREQWVYNGAYLYFQNGVLESFQN